MVCFAMFGLIGVVWCVFFYRWFRDHPSEHPSVNAAEREMLAEVSTLGAGHSDVPWAVLLSRGSTWLLWCGYFCMSFGWYFYITWLPTYLQEFRHQTPAQAARLAILPLLFGGFGAMICGFIATPIASRFGLARSRRMIAVCGMLGACVCLFCVTRISDALFAMIVMGLASFFNDLVMPPSWNACMDIGGKYAGSVAGSMNMMGNMAGFVAPVIGGKILQHGKDDWNVLIYLMSAVYIIGADLLAILSIPLRRSRPSASTRRIASAS